MLNNILNETAKVFKDLSIDKLFAKHDKIKIAVTGLNRSGKTVFIASLINHLLSGKNLNRPSKFIAKIKPHREQNIKEFDYYSIINTTRMTNPHWPQSTNNISKIEIEFEIKSKNNFLPNSIVNLEIIDYPGEWLLDMQMLHLSFREWSEDFFLDVKKYRREALISEWINELRKYDLYGFYEGEDINTIINLYHKYLKESYQNGFSILQPGRVVQTNSTINKKLLEFTPLPTPKYMSPYEKSIYNLFEQRYNKYVDEVLKPFYENWFSQFDRQIILIDVLKNFQNGYDQFLDMQRAIKKIIQIYYYGEQSFLKHLIDKKINKVIFAGTKVDLLKPEQHQNYQKLLNQIIEDAKRELDVKGIKTQSLVFASVKTNEATVDFEIPSTFPKRDKWENYKIHIPETKPIVFPELETEVVPSINMNILVDYLLGDKI